MEHFIFIGEGFLPELGIQPIFAPLSGSRTLAMSKFKPYLPYVNKLGYVNVVDERGLFFYKMFRDETIEVKGGTVKILKISDLLAEAKRVDGGVCDLLKSLQPVFYSYKDFVSGAEKVTYVLPVIVKYRNLWEHFSLAPIRTVKEQAEYYIYGGAVGIIVVDREASPKRPYARDIISKPTSVLLAEECGVEVELPKQKSAKREAKKVDDALSLIDAKR